MREEFERGILDDPDDRERYSVYADWLTEQGDPRGELIAVQLQLEDAATTAAERARISERERALMREHGQAFLGALAGPLIDEGESDNAWSFGYRHAFRRGFLDAIEASDLTVALLLALRASAETRFLRRLILLGTEYTEEPVEIDGQELDEDGALAGFLRAADFQSLREFQLGGLDSSNCHTNGEGVVDVLEGMPKLESLHLEAHNVSTTRLFGLPLPKLRHLRVNHLHQYPVSILAENESVAHLESVRFHPHALEPGDDEAYLTLADVRALAAAPHLTRLRHLELRLCDAGDAGLELILSSGLLSRLRVLDLKWGEVTDRGARLLLRQPDACRQLERLELGGNQLSAECIAELTKAGIPIAAEEQFSEGDSDREYLYHGDFE